MVGLAIVVTLAACSSTTAGSSSGTSASVTLTRSPIVIGNVGDYSGPYSASSDTGIRDGVLAWAQWTNAHGGIAGHPVHVIVKDDQGNPAESPAAVKELVQSDHVVALVGVADYLTDSTWANYVDTAKMPVIGGSAYSLSWTTKPMFFPVGTTLVDNIHAQSYLAHKTGAKKWGYFVCGEAPVCKQTPLLNSQLSTKLGMKIVYVGGVLTASSNYTAQCLAAKNSGATAIDVATILNTSTRLVQTCVQQGYHPHWIIADTLNDPSEPKNPAWQGAIGYTTVFPFFVNNSVTKDYQEAMAAYHNEPLNQANAMGWASGETLAKALSGATSARVTSAEILKGLYAFKGETLNGLVPPTTYNPGKPASPQPCFYTTAITNYEFTSSTGLTAYCPPAAWARL